jgi:hypothetical protein
MRQKYRFRQTSLYPVSVTDFSEAAGGVGCCQAGTSQAISSMVNTTNKANPMNKARHPNKGINHCTGKVDISMPKEPVISIHELVRSWAEASNQRRYPVKGAIKQALKPTPHNMRAASKPMKLVAVAKARHPKTATAKNAKLTFLGPKRSSHDPNGNWVSENPRK